jgi:hypothetical protein
VPFQILASDVISAGLSPIEFTSSFGEGPLGDFGPNEKISGVKKLDKTQLELGLRQLLGPRLGASQSILGVDVGWVHVHQLPGHDDLRLSAPGVTGEADSDHLPTSNSGATAGALITRACRPPLQPHAAWHVTFAASAPTRRPVPREPQVDQRGLAIDHQHLACSRPHDAVRRGPLQPAERPRLVRPGQILTRKTDGGVIGLASIALRPGSRWAPRAGK